MNKFLLKIFLAATGILLVGIISCKKNNLVVDNNVVPPEFAKFPLSGPLRYDVTSTDTEVKIPIGITNVSNTDRTITFSIASPSGAQQGVQYTAGTSIVVPAGQALDSIPVSAIYSAYSTGRKDTLVFTIEDGDVKAAPYNNKFTLYLFGPCYDGNISNINVISGDFDNTYEDGGSYGPYTTNVGTITMTSATTGTAIIDNLYDYFGPLTINFDWTDPDNTIVDIPLQQTDKNYDVGQPFLVRTSPGQPNKFSVCNQKISLIIDVLVDNYFGPGQAAYYSKDYEVILSR